MRKSYGNLPQGPPSWGTFGLTYNGPLYPALHREDPIFSVRLHKGTPWAFHSL